jgi:hypothetical protein
MKDTGIQMTRVGSREWVSTNGKRQRREEWTIIGGEIDPTWSIAAGGREPSSRFTLYVVDGKVDVRLASYGGVVWPTAWPELFKATHQGTYQAAIEITDLGLVYRDATLRQSTDHRPPTTVSQVSGSSATHPRNATGRLVLTECKRGLDDGMVWRAVRSKRRP